MQTPPPPAAAIAAIYPNTEPCQQVVNYLSLWNLDNMTRSHPAAEPGPGLVQFQYDYRAKRWYQYRETGTSASPQEIFIQFI